MAFFFQKSLKFSKNSHYTYIKIKRDSTIPKTARPQYTTEAGTRPATSEQEAAHEQITPATEARCRKSKKTAYQRNDRRATHRPAKRIRPRGKRNIHHAPDRLRKRAARNTPRGNRNPRAASPAQTIGERSTQTPQNRGADCRNPFSGSHTPYPPPDVSALQIAPADARRAGNPHSVHPATARQLGQSTLRRSQPRAGFETAASGRKPTAVGCGNSAEKTEEGKIVYSYQIFYYFCNKIDRL